MSIPATESVTTAGIFGTATNLQSSTATNAADKDTFLQLMVAQMKYQDPMNPTDSTAFLAQTAQFTALEKMQDVADQTALMLSAQMAFGASGLVGRTVGYTGPDGQPATGTVDGVTFGAEGPVLDIGGTQVPMTGVTSVTNTTGTSTGTSTGTGQ